MFIFRKFYFLLCEYLLNNTFDPTHENLFVQQSNGGFIYSKRISDALENKGLLDSLEAKQTLLSMFNFCNDYHQPKFEEKLKDLPQIELSSNGNTISPQPLCYIPKNNTIQFHLDEVLSRFEPLNITHSFLALLLFHEYSHAYQLTSMPKGECVLAFIDYIEQFNGTEVTKKRVRRLHEIIKMDDTDETGIQKTSLMIQLFELGADHLSGEVMKTAVENKIITSDEAIAAGEILSLCGSICHSGEEETLKNKNGRGSERMYQYLCGLGYTEEKILHLIST